MRTQQSLVVKSITRLKGALLLIEAVPQPGDVLPAMMPGQFVEVAVDGAGVLLNRPFSIFYADGDRLQLLVKVLGRATAYMQTLKAGDEIRVICPLGRGFSCSQYNRKVLLIGGGVGVAPFMYLARCYNRLGIRPALLFGERTTPDPVLLHRLGEAADIYICTEDASMGKKGFVTDSPLLDETYDIVQVCGPMPMMRAIYDNLKGRGINVEFSLENKMACGLGACLCCVEKTTTGNRCVCTDGPVFNISELPW